MNEFKKIEIDRELYLKERDNYIEQIKNRGWILSTLKPFFKYEDDKKIYVPEFSKKILTDFYLNFSKRALSSSYFYTVYEAIMDYITYLYNKGVIDKFTKQSMKFSFIYTQMTGSVVKDKYFEEHIFKDIQSFIEYYESINCKSEYVRYIIFFKFIGLTTNDLRNLTLNNLKDDIVLVNDNRYFINEELFPLYKSIISSIKNKLENRNKYKDEYKDKYKDEIIFKSNKGLPYESSAINSMINKYTNVPNLKISYKFINILSDIKTNKIDKIKINDFIKRYNLDYRRSYDFYNWICVHHNNLSNIFLFNLYRK